MSRSSQDLCDMVSLFCRCVDDDTFLITQEANIQELWIPSVKVLPELSWNATVKQVLKDIVLEGANYKICILYRVWAPGRNYIYHTVYEVYVSADMKRRHKAAASRITKYKPSWMTYTEVIQNYQRLRSIEILDFIAITTNTQARPPRAPPIAVNPEGSWTDLLKCDKPSSVIEIQEKHILAPINNSIHENLLVLANFTNSVQFSLYLQFLILCFPCTYMNQQVLFTFLSKLGWVRNNVIKVFKAADVYRRGFLSYRDFLYMIAVIEPNTPHGGPAGEMRSRYIFRYYDVDNSNSLDYEELQALYKDVRAVKTAETATFFKDFDSCAKALGCDSTNVVRLDRFLKAIGNLKLRGTSVLLRSVKSATALLPPTISGDQIKQASITTPDIISQSIARPQTTIFKKDMKDFEIAIHSIQVKKGNLINVQKLWTLNEAVCPTSPLGRNIQLERSISVEAFNPNGVHNEVLRGLQYFAQPITQEEATSKPGKKAKPPFSWGLVDPAGFANCVLNVCEKVTALLKEEPRLLELKSPIYVLGDFHGNFADLMTFEKFLWYMGPALSPCVFLFLGDFVDRGPHGIELISYLFAYKIQCPHKIKLIRGNHEMREVQKSFTFYNECVHKFGETLGLEVWNATNTAMDCLPLAAVIDDKVFCCHGGIPPPWLCPVIHTINSIPCPLPKPAEQSPLAWELMWNDPLQQQKISEGQMMEFASNEGFATNTNRGTGHLFNTESLEKFLTVNGLNMLLRAHQVVEMGFQVQLKSMMVTVFSSSHYCGRNNNAACILVDSGKLRAFRIE